MPVKNICVHVWVELQLNEPSDWQYFQSDWVKNRDSMDLLLGSPSGWIGRVPSPVIDWQAWLPKESGSILNQTCLI